MTGPPLVLFLQYRHGTGKVEPDVVCLSDPGPDGEPVLEEDGVPLRCGGWWSELDIEWGTENPQGLPVPGRDDDYPVPRLRLCPQCVARSTTPIPPPLRPGDS